jgi:hypothetical protein
MRREKVSGSVNEESCGFVKMFQSMPTDYHITSAAQVFR